MNAGAPWAYTTALVMIFAFLFIQFQTLDYGTRINDLPHIRDYKVTSNVAGGSALERTTVLGGESRPESLDLWMVRFKLYTVDADEVNNLVALARINPSQLRFDPRYYQYGGAYLYPLGAWYLALVRAGIIHPPVLSDLLEDPDRIDAVWIAGRCFVLLAFGLSAIFFFQALISVSTPTVSLLALGLYLLAPASIMFSQVLKPHWYGLLWVSIALCVFMQGITRQSFTRLHEFGLGASLGLAVGSAITFAPFTILLWGALAFSVKDGRAPVGALLRVPAIAIGTLLLANPYYILSWDAVAAERSAASTWFQPSLDPLPIVLFIKNSLAGGFGVLFTALLLAALALAIVRSGPAERKIGALALLAAILIPAAATANMATWHFNFRYLPYLLPVGLLVLSTCNWPGRTSLMALALAGSVVQAVPLMLAYHDENDTVHSTRFAAAAWVDTHIPLDQPVCLGTKTLTPFDAPPLRFDLRPTNMPDCQWKLVIERDADSAQAEPGFCAEKRFRPRLSSDAFPLVWGHINPQITLYRRSPAC